MKCSAAPIVTGDRSVAPWQPVCTWYMCAKAAAFFIGVRPPPCSTVMRR